MATLGKTDVGATGLDNGWQNSFILCKQIAPENGEITQISTYLKWGDTPNFAKGVIFRHDVANDRPLALLAEGSEVSVDGTTFYDFPVSYSMTPGEVLWIGVYLKRNKWSQGDAGAVKQTYIWAQGTYPTIPTPYNPPIGHFKTYDYEASIYATYTPTEAPPQGTLEVHAYEDSVEVGASVESVGTTPFTIPLNVGLYTLNATYRIHPTQTQNVEILEGQTTIVNFNFVLPPTHLLTVDSTPLQGVPFTIEKV